MDTNKLKATKKSFAPYISTLEMLDISSVGYLMEAKGHKVFIEHANWEDYPYKPIAAVSIARTNERLYLSYAVRGLYLLATTLNDNTPVYQDSCVEFFMQQTNAPYYYNFEFNCIGTCDASKRLSRDAKESLSKDEYLSIHRHSSIEREVFEEKPGMFCWSLDISIPFTTMGLDPNNLPEKIKVNFYKCADDSTLPHYLSWNPIDLPQPNFHCPDFFGELYL